MPNPRDNRNQGGPQPSKQGGRPSPSGVPNEGKGTPGQPGSNDDRGRNMPSPERHVPGGPDEDTRNPG